MYQRTHIQNGIGARLWLPAMEMDDAATNQIREAAMQPYVVDDIMVMPDAHGGYGLPVGGVMATDGSVVPYAVGVDIGCGMYACRTSLRHKDIMGLDLMEITAALHAAVPSGLGCRRVVPKGEFTSMPEAPPMDGVMAPMLAYEYREVETQMGTLGGGNHFVELQYDEMGYVCVMIHCGSRNLGKKVADWYSKRAAEMCATWKSKADNKELGFLPRDSKEWTQYMGDMEWCIDFARLNRKMIAKAVWAALIKVTGLTSMSVNFATDICHNFAAYEHHKGKNVLVHRKGACHIPKDRIGIIPGSMATGGYIVRGRGNVQAYDSCSHGAGRTMSRSQAKKTLSFEGELLKLAEAGSATQLTDLSESAGAYKDLDIVMERQKDLVEIVHHLKPILTIKGSTK